MTTAYHEHFATLGATGGPAWLAPIRSAAMARFEALGFPTPKNEDWHFTNVAPIAEGSFTAMGVPDRLPGAAQLAPFTFGHAEWPTLVFVNGRYAPSLSRVDTLPHGVRVMSLASALHEEPTLLEQHLTRITAFEDHAFSALNTALMQDGALIHVAQDTEVLAPIHLLFVSDAAAERGVAHVRNLIVVERNAKATVLEQYVATSDVVYFNNVVTEVSIADGATLQHHRLEREGRRAFHVGTVEAHQGRDSHFVSFSFAIGGSLSRVNVYTKLAGAGCGSTLNGLYLLDDEQLVDHQTRIEHVAPNCFSREMYKGILDGRSHGVFNGKVYVHPEAQKTDGKQTNNTLLLSEKARIDTKPQLEIFADDVKCTHGATIGRIDETALFYMKSRGISADTARQLLTYAFAAEVLETIELEPLKDELERLTLERYTQTVDGRR